MSRIVAVIGTAGRDKTKVMDLQLWNVMTADLRTRIRADDVLASGAAAWADHLAVHAFLQGWCSGLLLYLPAPLVNVGGRWQFEEAGPKSSGGAANWYHERFSQVLGVDTRLQIAAAQDRGAQVEAEPARPGFAGMFSRNKKVAGICNAAIAYTFNPAAEPADGGTLDTWRQIQAADRVHVDLGALQQCRPEVPRRGGLVPALRRGERYR